MKQPMFWLHDIFFWNIFRYRVKNNWIRSKKYHLEEKKKEILVRIGNYLEKSLLEFKRIIFWFSL